MIQLVNASTLVDDETVNRWAAALTVQLMRDVAPIWRGPDTMDDTHVFATKTPDPHLPAVVVVDHPDASGWAGWHSSTPEGIPNGFVFASAALDVGEEPSVLASHEVTEMWGDPFVTRWIAGWAVELDDPVEDQFYDVTVSGEDGDEPGFSVTVSDFVTPAWFGAGAGPFDFLERLSGPHQLTRGGYAVSGGPAGASLTGAPRRHKGAGSRTQRRLQALVPQLGLTTEPGRGGSFVPPRWSL